MSMIHLIPVSNGFLDVSLVKKLVAIRDDKNRILGYTAIMKDSSNVHLTPTEGRKVKMAKA